MVLNVEIDASEREILFTALCTLKTEALCFCNFERSEAIEALLNKLGFNLGV